MSIDKIFQFASAFTSLMLLSAFVHSGGKALDELAHQYIEAQWHNNSPNLKDSSKISVLNPRAMNDDAPNCTQPLRVHTNQSVRMGKNYVHISCPSPYWKQQRSVNIQVFQDVWVLSKGVTPGQTLSTDNVHISRMDISTIKGGFVVANTTPNYISKRHLPAGTILKHNMIKAPTLIARGDAVDIKLNRGGIRVQFSGTALSKGAKNEYIRVRSDGSNSVLKARVIERGIVQIQ